MASKLFVLAAVACTPTNAIKDVQHPAGYGASVLNAFKTDDSAAPTRKVVKLLKGLKANVVKDGEAEQLSYNTYACWCEAKLGEKAAAMNEGKELISAQQTLILKLGAELGSHGAEVKKLKKDIADNIASSRDATAVRSKESQDFRAEKVSKEQSVEALAAAMKVMKGAGTKKAFLDTNTHEAQLLSVAGDLRSVMDQETMPSSIPMNDIEMINRFVAKPQDFLSANSGVMSAAQLGQNPFGDYAPKSDSIQGIFKGMHDAFTADLKKSNEEEAQSQKSFKELMATKSSEKKTLSKELLDQETASADKTKKLADAHRLEDDTADQVEADGNFFESTKDACETKAKDWSVRTRLRTEELAGMAQAIAILSKGGKTLEKSFGNFLQVSSVTKHQEMGLKAFEKIRMLASKYKSMKLAGLAVAARSSGHFDKVMASIDAMVGTLRAEGQADIKHRDYCENNMNANSNELSDLKYAIKKTQKQVKRMASSRKEVQLEVGKLKADIGSTKKGMKELSSFRSKESAEYKQAHKDDTEAVALMGGAIDSLEAFYKKNALVQTSEVASKAPTYSKDKDASPGTSFKGAAYGGRKSETTGIVAMLSMLVEDIQKEIKESNADDADAQDRYEKQLDALKETLDAQIETKVSKEEEMADLTEKIADAQRFKKGKQGDAAASKDKKALIYQDCAWVKTHFKPRASKRAEEIEGLGEAKAFLSGGGDGLPPLM